jgi:hypothetical protein
VPSRWALPSACPSLLLLVQNTALLGAMLWLYHGQGLTT